jgi:hypothetical protein
LPLGHQRLISNGQFYPRVEIGNVSMKSLPAHTKRIFKKSQFLTVPAGEHSTLNPAYYIVP